MVQSTPALETELLTVQQAAKLLNVGRNQVYAWAKARRVPCIRWGRRYRFPRQALLRWVDEQVNVHD